MRLQTILNRVRKFKSFVYGKIRWVEDATEPTLEVELIARKNSRPICSKCGCPGPKEGTTPTRKFEFVPMWGIKVFFVYAPRRVKCPTCGVRVEKMPWVDGKHRLTDTYAWFLAGWAKRISWKEVADSFHTSWYNVFHSVEMAVNWGLEHRVLSGIKAIGIDEIQWRRGHHYLTLVYQIDTGLRRLLWIGDKRQIKTLLRFFRWFTKERTAALRYICSDMWKPYLKVIAKKAGGAIHILDRFHIMAHLGKAIDEVRAKEVRELKEKGEEPVLTKSRWLLLKRPENLTEQQGSKLDELVKLNLKTIRSYLLKEEFQLFWSYNSPDYAGIFLDNWCEKTMRSKIDPMKRVSRMLKKHKTLLLNWFRAGGLFSSGIVEGLNTKAKLTTRKAYGFRTYHAIEIALYHALGNLPVPDTTHKFF